MSETEWRAPKWEGPRWRNEGAAMYSEGDEGVAVMACSPGLAHELTLELNAREAAALPVVAFEVQRREDLSAEFRRHICTAEKSRDRAQDQVARLRAVAEAAEAIHHQHHTAEGLRPEDPEWSALGVALEALEGGDRG